METLVLFQGTSEPFSYELLDELESLQLTVQQRFHFFGGFLRYERPWNLLLLG